MLQAILKGKAGRIDLSDDHTRSWRELFRRREDLLTATFFGRLRYLSETGKRNVLASLISPEPSRPETTFGAIQEILFWPKLKRDISDRGFTEPDILIKCEQAYFLIEVKPPFGGPQLPAQWKNEIDALIKHAERNNANWELPDTIHFVALGKNSHKWNDDKERLTANYAKQGLTIHTIEWGTLQRGIVQLQKLATAQDAAVYSDWLEAFALFGLDEPPLPFKDLLEFGNVAFKKWQGLSEKMLGHQLAKRRAPWSALSQMANKNKLRIDLWA